MTRHSLLIICLFMISLNVCFSEILLEKNVGGLFGIALPDVLKDKSETDINIDNDRVNQQNGNLCKSNFDCLYGGNCTDNGTCSCPEGTSGSLCEDVLACIQNPGMCGNSTDVHCVFDPEYKIAECACVDEKKSFNDFRKRCAKPCSRSPDNCGEYGRCSETGFCWCIKGVSGDRCEIIDQCHNGEVDCGDDPSASCSLGIDGAYCKCNKPYQIFDNKGMVCKGEPCKNNTDCFYGGNCTDDGTCWCPKGTGGHLCQNVVECIENPDKCGSGSDVKCVFDPKSGTAECVCVDKKMWFNNFRKKCAKPCQMSPDNCGKYGRCSPNTAFCWCVDGVSGDRCEIIDQCESGEVDCDNDPSAICTLGIDGAYCKCNETYQLFDKEEQICKGEPCRNSSDCLYLGDCTEDGTCFCRKGTGGPLCQQVDECLKNPGMCGSGADVKCIFDVSNDKAVCKCDEEEKSFDGIQKQCRKECNSSESCGIYGRCDRYSFCRCLEGVSGDNCDTIDKCKKLNCGLQANCILGGDGEAHCKCLDPRQGFDYKNKVCKNCECGPNSKGCEFHEGGKICDCALNYFSKGNVCEACNCGEMSRGCEFRNGKKACFCPLNYTDNGDTCQKCNCGIESYHCRIEGGKMTCVCYGPFKQRKDKCEYCDCGLHDGDCSFSDSGKKQCTCKEGFTMSRVTGFCTEMCNATNKCQNRGMCLEGLCQCRQDYAGPLCQTPKWCLHSRCGGGADVHCLWDGVKREGQCKCNKLNHVYNEENRSCVECDCGSEGSCTLVNGEKVCFCRKGYAEFSSQCKACDCGPGSTNCTFQSSGRKLCQCAERYRVKTGYEDNSCSYCDCGDHGTCRFNGEQKVCDCEEKHKVYNGGCQKCDCGLHGLCNFSSDGHKQCTCDFGYSVLAGKCEKCDCEPPNMRGLGTICSFVKSMKTCQCPSGYQSLTNNYCEDIDECLNETACPANTICLNLPGSYDCHCKKGFRMVNPEVDPKQSGCKDINECVGNPCKDSNTVCVNSLGSYDCKCKEGYYPTSSASGPYYNPMYTTCNSIETQWRSASIALVVILSIGVVGAGGYVFYRRKK